MGYGQSPELSRANFVEDYAIEGFAFSWLGVTAIEVLRGFTYLIQGDASLGHYGTMVISVVKRGG